MAGIDRLHLEDVTRGVRDHRANPKNPSRHSRSAWKWRVAQRGERDNARGLFGLLTQTEEL